MNGAGAAAVRRGQHDVGLAALPVSCLGMALHFQRRRWIEFFILFLGEETRPLTIRVEGLCL